MGIKDLDITPNEAGKIKIGGKGKLTESTNGKKFRLPVKYDHFEITLTDRDEEGQLIPDKELVKRIIEAGSGIVNEKGELVGIPVRFLYDSTDLNFPTEYRRHKDGALACKGDGKTCLRAVTDFNPEKSKECPGKNCKYQATDCKPADRCKATGKLSCVIDEASFFGQAHVFRTTSFNSVSGIIAGVELIKSATGGKIAGLPLMLTLNPKHTTIPGSGAPTIVYVVSVCFRGTMSHLRQAAIQLVTEERQYLIGMDEIEEDARAAGIGTVTTPEEESDERAEFFPDAAVEADFEVVSSEIISPENVDTESGEDQNAGNNDSGETDNQGQDNEDTDPIQAEKIEKEKAQLALVDRLSNEDDKDKAIKLAKRINTNHLVAWVKDTYVYTSVYSGNLPESERSKTMWLTLANKLIFEHGTKPSVKLTGTELTQKERVSLRLKRFKNEIDDISELGIICGYVDHATAVRCIGKRFDQPIDSSLDMDGLCKFAYKLLCQERDNADGSKNQDIQDGNDYIPDSDDAGPEDQSEKSDNQPDPFAWDDGDETGDDQKAEIRSHVKRLGLKKAEWFEIVTKYRDKDGKPATTVTSMSRKQSAHLIANLDDIQF